MNIRKLVCAFILFLFPQVSYAKYEAIEIPYVPAEVTEFPIVLKEICDEPRRVTDYIGVCVKLDKGSTLDIDAINKLVYVYDNIATVKSRLATKGSFTLRDQPADKGAGINAPTASLLETSAQPLTSFVDKVSAGLAEFAIERAKSEAVLFFQEELRENICSTETNAAGFRNIDFFYNFCNAIAAVDTSLSPQAMSSYVRSAAKQDIERLPDVVAAYMAQRALLTDKLVAKKTPTSIWAMLSCLTLAQGNAAQCFPGDAQSRKEISDYLTDIAESLLKLKQQSLQAKRTLDKIEREPNDLDKAAFAAMVKDLAESVLGADDADRMKYIKLYRNLTAARLGLAIYREAATAREPLDIIRSLSELPNTVCEGNSECTALIEGAKKAGALIKALEAHGDAIRDLQYSDVRQQFSYGSIGAVLTYAKETSTKLDKDKINTMYQSCSRLYADIVAILKLAQQARAAEAEVWPADPDKAALHQRQILQLRLNLVERAISVMIASMNILGNNELALVDAESVAALKKIQGVVRVGREIIGQDSGRLTVASLELVRKVEADTGVDNIIPERVRGTMGVVAELANAKDGKEVATIMQAAAAPVGSYRMKKKRTMTSLTILGGYSVGREQYSGALEEGHRYSAVFFPLGIHWTTPTREGTDSSRDNKAFHSVGAFLSILDLGQAVAARSTDQPGSATAETNAQLSRLLSPGIYGTLGLYGPLTLGAGVSYTPEVLRTTAGEPVSAYRWQVFLSFDLTVFAF
jgi:hypothetical protein